MQTCSYSSKTLVKNIKNFAYKFWDISMAEADMRLKMIDESKNLVELEPDTKIDLYFQGKSNLKQAKVIFYIESDRYNLSRQQSS